MNVIAHPLETAQALRTAAPGFDINVLQLPFSWPKWNLVHEFLRFRKKVFVDTLAWSLNHHEGIEYEQYDTLDSVYVVAHEGDRICGGARLRRTDRLTGTGRVVYSYMIRDAHLGLLEGMPPELCFRLPPRSASIWELTRLATSRNFEVTKAILDGANRFLASRDADRCFFLGSPAFMRMAKGMGYQPSALGPVVSNRDGRFVAFSCPVRYPAAP